MTDDKITKRQKKLKRVIPRLKPVPYSVHDLNSSLKPPSTTKQTTINNINFYATEEHPYNKRGFKYKCCRPNPYFSSMMYSTSDLPPFTARISYFDRSMGLLIDKTCLKATALQGWRSSRTSMGIREGKWYVEFKLLKANDGESNIRIGFARREANIEAPVGYDGYGYGFRDKLGQRVHLSKPTDFLTNGEEFKTGDVIGLLIELPPLEEQKKIARLQAEQKTLSDPETIKKELEDANQVYEIFDKGILRDQIPIKYKNQMFFEQYEYQSTKQMEHLLNPLTVFGERAIPDKERFKPCRLPNSSITLYKNGINKGVAFNDLYAFLPPSSHHHQLKPSKHSDEKFTVSNDDATSGYYPMISCFRKGIVEFHPGPELEFVPEDLKHDIESKKVRLFCERYNDKVVEDVVYDIIDEVTNRSLDRVELSLNSSV